MRENQLISVQVAYHKYINTLSIAFIQEEVEKERHDNEAEKCIIGKCNTAKDYKSYI